MKLYIKLLLSVGAILILASCSDNLGQNEENEGASDPIEFKGLNASLGAMEANDNAQKSKKVEDFAVNTDKDPTASMTFRTNWELDVQVYKGGNPYPEGAATFTWAALAQVWEPNTAIFFPNYTKQFVSAKLYPPTWQNRVDEVQNTEGLLLAQDILTQNGDNTVTVNPAHIPTIEMRHGHSMLDFILDDVDENHIKSLKVHVGSLVYTPYRVVNNGKVEYLLIIPEASINPEIRMTTVDGAIYSERVDIGNNSRANVAYCAHIKGVELTLSTITIVDWTFGKALSGDYSASTSYPTFQGEPSAIYTLYFDNGLQQDITFNSNGERTIKPVGRTLIKVEKDGRFVDLKIVLRSMVIDLVPYFE